MNIGSGSDAFHSKKPNHDDIVGSDGIAAWTAQWDREEAIVQTMSEDKCTHLIDYVRQLWENQDEWIKLRHPLVRRSSFAIAWQGGGEVAAIPSGADKIRSFHPTTYIMDKAAYLPEGEDCLAAVRPRWRSDYLHLDGSGWMVWNSVLTMSDSRFHRFCGHCGLPIPWERLLKAITSKTKVFFCRDLCRFADANAKNSAAKQLRQENPNRRTCSECHGRGYTRVNGIA